MFGSVVDEASAVFLGVHTGVTDDEDFAATVEAVEGYDRWAVARGVPCVIVLIIDPESRAPPAPWRKRFAESLNSLQSAETYMVLVTRSALIQGAVTAVTWLLGDRNRLRATRSLAEAQAWLQERLGRGLHSLEALEQRARRAAEGGG